MVLSISDLGREEKEPSLFTPNTKTRPLYDWRKHKCVELGALFLMRVQISSQSHSIPLELDTNCRGVAV